MIKHCGPKNINQKTLIKLLVKNLRSINSSNGCKHGKIFIFMAIRDKLKVPSIHFDHLETSIRKLLYYLEMQESEKLQLLDF